jgi:hypothetical protein
VSSFPGIGQSSAVLSRQCSSVHVQEDTSRELRSSAQILVPSLGVKNLPSSTTA